MDMPWNPATITIFPLETSSGCARRLDIDDLGLGMCGVRHDLHLGPGKGDGLKAQGMDGHGDRATETCSPVDRSMSISRSGRSLAIS